jgi:hypothetical protein
MPIPQNSQAQLREEECAARRVGRASFYKAYAYGNDQRVLKLLTCMTLASALSCCARPQSGYLAPLYLLCPFWVARSEIRHWLVQAAHIVSLHLALWRNLNLDIVCPHEHCHLVTQSTRSIKRARAKDCTYQCPIASRAIAKRLKYFAALRSQAAR